MSRVIVIGCIVVILLSGEGIGVWRIGGIIIEWNGCVSVSVGKYVVFGTVVWVWGRVLGKILLL